MHVTHMGVHYYSNVFKKFEVFLLIPPMPLCLILLEKRKTHTCRHEPCYTRSLKSLCKLLFRWIIERM